MPGDVLAGLLAGELSGTDLQRRLEPFGLAGTVSALALPKPHERRVRRAAARVVVAEAALAAALRAEATPALVATNGQVVALIPGHGRGGAVRAWPSASPTA